jgi:hypothetical protein
MRTDRRIAFAMRRSSRRRDDFEGPQPRRIQHRDHVLMISATINPGAMTRRGHRRALTARCGMSRPGAELMTRPRSSGLT